MPVRTTPFHERTAALNETSLWSHWSGHLAAEKYQLSEKAEYVSVRNAAGLFDVSPLYKYRFSGRGAERFLGGVLARDARTLKPGDAHYALWCDDRGFLIEDGVLLRHGPDEFVLTAAEPNLAYFEDLVRPRDDVRIEDVSTDWAVLAVQGPGRGASSPVSTPASTGSPTSATARRASAATRSTSRARASPATSATRSGAAPTTRLTSGTRSGPPPEGTASSRSGCRRST